MESHVIDKILLPRYVSPIRIGHWEAIVFAFLKTEADKICAAISSYPTDVAFPQLDAFPDTLFGNSSQELGVRAALVSSSETSSRIKDLSRVISKAIEVETREALLNDLAGLGAAYEQGWQSGSDADEDE